jgi:hypothetical protein
MDFIFGFIYISAILSLIGYALKKDKSNQERIDNFKRNILEKISMEDSINKFHIEIACLNYGLDPLKRDKAINDLLFSSIISIHVDDNGCIYYKKLGD